MICVTIPQYRLPDGYAPACVDLLLRLPPGFPDVPPDMFWTDPVVTYNDGHPPLATELRESYLGRSWQRFSRHLEPAAWRPGQDSLQSYITLIHNDLAREASQRG